MKKLCFFILCSFVFSHFQFSRAQRNSVYIAYIQKYKEYAIEQMMRYKIPASITLAQGLLESGAGQSTLARKANNHFGIKCGSGWKGKYFIQDDDYKNERFRVYRNVKESYHDHSLFLKRPRYEKLFHLNPTDYKGWARGLKKAGYATNPRYAELLINLIERYDLYQYDYEASYWKKHHKHTPNEITHKVYFNNDNYYIIARKGDTFKSIGEEMGVSYRKIIKYNELEKDYAIQEGDWIYLEKKQKKAEKKFRDFIHIVQSNESLHSISQKYGMRLKTLYKLNELPPYYTLKVGDKLRIR